MMCGVFGVQLQGRPMAFSRKVLVHGVKGYDKVDMCLNSFLTSALDGGERSASHLSLSLCFALQGNHPDHIASKAGLTFF